MFDRNFSEALSIEQPPNSAQIAGYQILHYWGRRLYKVKDGMVRGDGGKPKNDKGEGSASFSNPKVISFRDDSLFCQLKSN